ncbi:G-type lectin S-receptor-like serine/threonine-protein kinase At4g03230 [Telopea speciosissima]|uniref:G-type lectin S-receptor-like serine/threonine-protein kinase At4g03230 n=1 Tax=Telopea speciosissima TaxID=54955 RepID=UPI001CC5CE43|nr:G-type lectin S-receptor-like serine/threonine-protein kinase At4g03230 [Telopea speciosissima]
MIIYSTLFLLSCSSHLLLSSAEIIRRDMITKNQVILDNGETMVSKGEKFEFGFFTPDGAKHHKRYVGIWIYDGFSQNSETVVWVANRTNPLPNSKGSISIRDDGNLTVLDEVGNIYFTTAASTMNTTTISAKLMDSGNLILTGENGDDYPIWQSFLQDDSSTFLPGMEIMSKSTIHTNARHFLGSLYHWLYSENSVHLLKSAYRESDQEMSAFPFDGDSEHARDPNKFGKDEKTIDVPFFDFESIMAATNNFSNLNKLGQGGFGPVYKGMLMGGKEIAVKRVSRSSGQGLEEFKNEVLLIAKLQHRNLVRLLGYSIKGDEKILLYEYMPNKSLDSFIFGQSRCALLNWEKRFNIILGIARGLLYLHQDSRLRIIHRDLKTSNILLDEEMNPKISDFGLARIFGGNQSAENTNRVVGTYGYMSPEYAFDGIFSTKSDIFSFGVVLLEIISGMKNAGFHSEHSLSLLGYAWELWKEDKVLDFMDKSLLCESYNAHEVSKCFHVGLLCVQEDAGRRPTMSNVIFMLGSEIVTLPTPKEPAFIARKYCPSNTGSRSGRPEMYSNNELTITEEQGR